MEDIYDDGMQKLVIRLDKCLNIGKNDVEKQFKVQAFIQE